MRAFKIGLLCAMFVGVFAFAAFAQTTTAGVIAVVDPYEFADDANGIKRYVAAAKKLDAEFAAEDAQLKTLATQITNLRKEIQTLQANKGTVPVDLQKKTEEHDNLAREYKFKEENRNAKYQSRGAQVMGPINQEIGKALQDFMAKKGFAMILDASRLEQAGLILAFDQKYNATKDFIVYFNALPAGTATK
ncbi:MAG: OmpH family outer membrane protein [Pyrinomonadaceae bacterium]